VRIILLFCCATLLVVIGAGYLIHLNLGGDALTAWGNYLTGTATLILAFAAVAAGSLAISDYRKRMVAEKSKWLLQLYEKLFENPQYKSVRRQLDFEDTDDIRALIKLDADKGKFAPDEQTRFDAFTDYLNFFELVAHLKVIGQLTSDDIQATFDYYLKLLTPQHNPQIRSYLKKEGFENLDRLLQNEYDSKK
jgi:hypothetical protein